MVESALALVVVALGLTVGHGYRRLREVLERTGQLERERVRVHVAIQRVARSLDDRLDHSTTLDVALGTMVDAVAAAAGRARLVGSYQARTFEAVPQQPGAGDAEALLAAERAALAGRGARECHDGWWALGSPLLATREPQPDPIGAVSVCRRMPFSREERELFAYLAVQTAASLEAVMLHERLIEHGLQDTLTGLASHRRFHEVLERQVEEALGARRPLSVLLLDLDDFRGVNAAFGHAAGDQVLGAVGQVVRDHCPPTGEAGRYGGQQIAVALPGRDVDGAWTVAEHIRADIAALDLEFGEGDVEITASAGIVELSARVASSEGLMFAADAALEEAKRAGKNRTVGFRGPYPADGAWMRRLRSR
jgi:diguanylate cyclase (GGDEF)-like protein